MFKIKKTKKKLYKKEIKYFVCIGILSVLIDFTIYHFAKYLGIILFISKGIGFIGGGYFSYFMNKNYTFQIKSSSKVQVIKFAIFFITSLLLNISTNGYFLNILTGTNIFKYQITFLIATSISAVYNFLGMKILVFKKKDK